MELKVGMYVRNENGISKYLGLGKDVLTNNESNQFKYYANQHLFDRNIFDVGHDWGDTLSDEEFKNIDKYIEKEPSYDVIDLIEVGDYVNGYKVVRIFTNVFNNQKVLVCSQNEKEEDFDYSDDISDYMSDEFIHIYNEDIKSIVTKEQFNSVKYEVE